MLSKPLGAVERANDERVELEPAKRIALLSAVVEVLEGLAWKMTERAKERQVSSSRCPCVKADLFCASFVDFLAADAAVATLLDPHQPVALLTSTTRLLSSLACRGLNQNPAETSSLTPHPPDPTLFRAIAGIKFYEANDVRGSKFPLFDRLASHLAPKITATETQVRRPVQIGES